MCYVLSHVQTYTRYPFSLVSSKLWANSKFTLSLLSDGYILPTCLSLSFIICHSAFKAIIFNLTCLESQTRPDVYHRGRGFSFQSFCSALLSTNQRTVWVGSYSGDTHSTPAALTHTHTLTGADMMHVAILLLIIFTGKTSCFRCVYMYTEKWFEFQSQRQPSLNDDFSCNSIFHHTCIVYIRCRNCLRMWSQCFQSANLQPKIQFFLLPFLIWQKKKQQFIERRNIFLNVWLKWTRNPEDPLLSLHLHFKNVQRRLGYLLSVSQRSI